MSRYDPEAEAVGQYMVAFVESAGKVSPVFERKVRQIFEDNLGRLEADAWYTNRDITDAFDEILRQVGEKTMMEGGVESGKAIEWGDDVTTVMDALNGWNDKHKAAYRNSDLEFPAGKYTVAEAGDRTARVGITEGYNLSAAFAKGCSKGIARDVGPTDRGTSVEDIAPEDGESAAWTLSW